MTERISQSGSHSQQAQFHVTHTELLNLAKTNHCAGIQVEPLLALCRPEKNRWVFEATVYKSAKCRGFAGLRGSSSREGFSLELQPRRNGHGRNPSRQPRPPHGLQCRHLLARSAATLDPFARAAVRIAPRPSVPTADSERSSV